MGSSIICRLGFLISPKAELLSFLKLPATGDHLLCESITVITPALDYEEAFEGWKLAWKAKAKQDFVADIVRRCSAEFPRFTNQLINGPIDELFDKWWTLSELSVMEIDPSWRPS